MVSLAKTVRSSVLLTDPIEIKSSCLREALGVSFLQCPSSLSPEHNSETFFLQSGDLKPFAHHLLSTNYRQQLSPFAINNLLSSYELAMCVKANLTVFPSIALLTHNLRAQVIWGNNKTVSLRSSVIQLRPEYSESPRFAENCSILTLLCKMLWNGNTHLIHQLQRLNSNRKQGHHYPVSLTSPEKTLCSCASLKC